MWGMLARIGIALVLAYFVTGLVADFLSTSDGTPMEAGVLARIAERGWSLAERSWPFALFAVAVAEFAGIRAIIYYLAAGALVAIGAASFDHGSWDFDFVSSWLPRWRDGILAMGVAGGLTYWLAHGHKTGLASSSIREAIANDPLSLLVGSMSTSRGLLASLAGLAAVTGIAWWALDENRFNDLPSRNAESEVGAALSAGGYPWAKLKIVEDVGQVVGLAPDEHKRAAAFKTAEQIAQPMIGATGVMTSLQNRLTAPDPVAVAAAQAAARRAAEADAAKRKAEEDAKRKVELEAKRKRDEQTRRVAAAAEAESKRKAEEARRAAVAAEAEAKRKAEAEAKRVAAEMEAKRVAAEAEAKRIFDEEARRVALEAEVAKRKAEEAANRIAAEAEVKRKADEEIKRLAAETKRKAAEDAQRLVAAVQAQQAEDSAKRKAAEEQAAKREADAAAKRLAAEAKRATDNAAKRLAAAMADRKADIPGKIAAVPAGPAPTRPTPRAPGAAATGPAAASLPSAPCAAEPLAVITGTRIALKRSDAALAPETLGQLDRLAEALKMCGDVTVRLAGFSTRGFDRRAKADHSRLLAARVATELGNRGITKERLRTAGLGAAKILTKATDLPGRRVELAVLAAPTKAAVAQTAASCTSDPAALRLKFGSSQDLPGGGYRTEVDRIARILSACANARFVIEGHTDSTGTDDLNKRLSLRRAELVKRALVRRGIPEANISAIGLGSVKQLDTTGTPAAKAANRRVDIVILPGLSPTVAAPPSAPPPGPTIKK